MWRPLPICARAVLRSVEDSSSVRPDGDLVPVLLEACAPRPCSGCGWSGRPHAVLGVRVATRPGSGPPIPLLARTGRSWRGVVRRGPGEASGLLGLRLLSLSLASAGSAGSGGWSFTSDLRLKVKMSSSMESSPEVTGLPLCVGPRCGFSFCLALASAGSMGPGRRSSSSDPRLKVNMSSSEDTSDKVTGRSSCSASAQ